MRYKNPSLESRLFPLWLFGTAFAISVLATVAGAVSSWQLNRRVDDARERQAALQQYIAEVRLFDEALTMSARMAAATGDRAYEQRYNKYDGELDALLKRTEGATRDPQTRYFIERTDEANRKLVEMERHALALTTAGRNSEASALLVNEEYLRWKNAYADAVSGVVAWNQKAIRDEDLSIDLLRLGSETSNGVILLVLLATWYLSFQAGRRWNQERSNIDAALSRAHDELENRVERRTADLKVANEALQSNTQALLREVEERERGAAALAESQQVLDSIINTVAARIFWKDKNLVYLGCNALFAHDAGFGRPEDVVGRTDYQMGWRDQAELYRRDDIQVIASGQSKLLIEEPQTTPDGKSITLLTNKVPLRNRNGEIIGVLGTYMDITERKRLEENLRESEEKFRSVAEVAQDAIIMIDARSAVVYWNPAAQRIFGYSAAEASGRKVHEFLAPERYRAAAAAGIEAFAKSGQGPVIGKTLGLVALRKDGSEFPIELSIGAARIADAWSAIAIIRDITERTHVEKAVPRSEEEYGNFAESAADHI